MHTKQWLIAIGVAALALQGCTYNHYYQNGSEMMATPAGETAIAKSAATKPTKKVVIYRVH
ncbi:hypothetical protein ACFQ45_00435 [Rhodanobacter aciditrophus]|uniref:Uncharacterized protein n=1 Tax=Rhodanobacter aciditrophus TaxID=1623218 RepID=A0ABW4AVQ7_9GAMM